MATRIDVAKAVAERQKISVQDANSIIGTTIEVISELVKKEDLHLVGLGGFRRVTLPARQGRNPKTGESISIPEKVVVRFKPSKSLNPSRPAADVTAVTKGRGRSGGRKPAGNKRKSSR